MCILCVVQKWSRKVANMLPWLVIPLIGLWALSQLLPPAFRFEITSPRLACVLVLLVTLFWYEVLMPQLSAWRIRRNARLRERKRIEAVEMDKLRKTATRRCRNCLTPYRDQNPGGGKFMCAYCGLISKRPVLDLPVSSGMGNSGILKDLVGKGGKILNGKAWDNGWICGQDWLENGNWGGGPVAGNLGDWKNSGLFVGDDHCLTEKSYSSFFVSACKSFTAFFFCVMRLWRKIFRASSSRADTAADAERKRMLDKQGEKGGNCQESRGEKARRKAEEKRQARLEKELMEEEERKQREEVARLVEERRRLRDEKMDSERECGKGSPPAKERDCKKEAEKKSRERKKERDRGSSKSNSDVDELDKKAGKESDRNSNKKSVSDRKEQHRNTSESVKTHCTEVGLGSKNVAASNHSRGNAGTRYLDCMKGTFLSSSRAFSGGGLFGKSTSTNTVSREHIPNTLVDHTQTSMHKKEIVQPDLSSGRSNVNGDDKSINHSVLAEPSKCPAPKKSWQQLFTRSSAVPPPSNSSVISRPNEKCQSEIHSPAFPSQPTSTQSFNNPINFGLPSPFNLPSFPSGSSNSSIHLPSSSEPMFPKIRDVSHQYLPEDSEIFEDPCYVPDPVSLLGPVSESLDDFQLDLGFIRVKGMAKPCCVKPLEVTKLSPIESPLSRFKVSEERHPTSYLFPSTPRAQDNSSNMTDNRTWQMWNSSPLGQNGLGLVGGPANWLFPPDVNVPKNDDTIHSVPHKTMASLFKKDETVTPTHSSQNTFFGNGQNGGTFNTLPVGVNGPWLPKNFGGLTSSNETQILLKPNMGVAQNGLIYGNSSGPACNHQFEMSTSISWSKKDGTTQGSRNGIGNSPIGSMPYFGGLYSPPDVRSLWSYE